MIAESYRISSGRCLAGLLLRLVLGGLAACFGGGQVAAEICAELCAFFGSAARGESEYESRGAGLEDRVESAECGK